MAETTDAFSPNADLVGKMVFFIVLVIFLIFIIGFLVMSFRKPTERNYGPVKNNVIANVVTDTIKHKPVKNQHLDCPKDPLKYSYTFFLTIDDYYCNRGYWKCIMIKGSEVTKDGDRCTSTVKSLVGSSNTKFNVEKFKVDNETDSKKSYDMARLYNKINNNPDGIKITNNSDLFKRLDIICSALKAGDDGVNMLVDAVVNWGFFTDENGESYKMTEGTCRDFINKHKTYCNEIYKVDKKVSRQDDAERFRRIQALEEQIQNIKDAGKKQSLQGEIIRLENAADEERKFDDYDSICSADNYLKKYPGLIPTTVEVFKENDLINLSQKNNMDLIHTIDDSVNLEGCYPLKSADGTEIFKLPKEIKTITSTDESYIIQECNRAAEEAGYDYYGIQQTGDAKTVKCYGFQKSDLIPLQSKRTDDSTCDANFATSRKSNNTGHIYVSKVVHPGEHIVSDCWTNVINKYPYQSPGIWLHPFINNIRVVFTTNSPDEYSRHINDQSHANPGNDYNTEVKKVPKNQPKHPGVQDYEEDKSCPNGTIPTANNYYRESFDILNIPINNEFHLALIVNDHIVEVYMNGELKQSMKLFGNPTFNQGDLHINPESKPKLGGKVSQFQFFPIAIDYNNIQKIMEMRVARQSLGSEPIGVSKEHGHMIEISHDHEFHPQEEADHRHSIDGKEIVDYS